MSENELRLQIISLEKELEEKRKLLFSNRVKVMYHGLEISDIKISTDDVKWSIEYTHKTDKYSDVNYLIKNAECSAELKTPDSTVVKNTKESRIIVGFNGKKYYIKGGIKLNIYRTKKEIMIFNPEYDLEIDIDDHIDLIKRYMRNVNIPEAAAISILNYISENKWDDASMIIYLSKY